MWPVSYFLGRQISWWWNQPHCFICKGDSKSHQMSINKLRASTWAQVPSGFYQNCRGLRSKLSIFNYNVAIFNYAFIFLSEISVFSDSKLGISNYIIFRCDRNISTSNLSRGGDVLIFIHNDIPSSILTTYSMSKALSMYS
jgi:hypothetical protein